MSSRQQGTWSAFALLVGGENPLAAAIDDAGNTTVITFKDNSGISQSLYAYTRDGTRSLGAVSVAPCPHARPTLPRR